MFAAPAQGKAGRLMPLTNVKGGLPDALARACRRLYPHQVRQVDQSSQSHFLPPHTSSSSLQSSASDNPGL